MKMNINFKSIVIAIFTSVILIFSSCRKSEEVTHSVESDEPSIKISWTHGKLMLIGTGEITSNDAATFAYLSGEKNGKLIVLTDGSNQNISSLWQDLFGEVVIIELDESKSELGSADLAVFKTATALWLENDLSKRFAGTKLNDEIKMLFRKCRTVGGQGKAAEGLASFVKDGHEIREGFGLLSNSYVHATDNDQFNEIIDHLPGRIGWEIPSGGSVVIYKGRQISVVGDNEITIKVAANGEWNERVATFKQVNNRSYDNLPYSTDLVSWNRSAIARLGDLFPPTVAPVPEVAKGALMIIGGSGYPENMWEDVVAFSGGVDAKYVCLTQTESSTGAEKLKDLGCTNVSVYVVSENSNGVQNVNDPALLEAIENADMLYFGGGRTYKYMDSYVGTQAQVKMNGLLERGGIIVGSSAGAQILGDFLVRGDPRTNDTLWMEGNDLGLSFIRGVIIDAHFRQRGREYTLPTLLMKHPQMLGIGIDEATALFVQGTDAKVLGKNAVTFYDLKNQKVWNTPFLEIGDPIVLYSGEVYNLKERKRN